MWISIQETLPLWIRILLHTPIGLVAAGIYYEFAASPPVAAPWPYCERCAMRRRTMRGLAIAAASLGAATFAAGEVWASLPAPAPLVLRITGLVTLLAAIPIWSFASWRAISGARLDDHSEFIEVANPHQMFAAQADAAQRRAATQAILRGQNPSQPRPQQLIGKLNTLWYFALIVGIVLIGAAVLSLGGPQCGVKRMEPGDVCETVEYSSTKVSTYAQKQQWVRLQQAGGIAGAVMILVSGIRIRRWNSALKRAYAEASGNAVA